MTCSTMGLAFSIRCAHSSRLRATISSGSRPSGREATRKSACRRASLRSKPARIEVELAFAVHGRTRCIQAAQDGFLAGGIRVESQYDPPGKLFEQAQLVLSQRRTHRGNDVFIACLVQGNDIQVAFDDHRLVCGADRPCVPCPDRRAGVPS